MAQADVVLRGGLVVDGSGAPGFEADVAVAGGRIVAIGDGLEGREVLDASGCVVAPGFVDLHTHYDPQATWDPWLTPSGHLGVTSVVAGNCGFSLAPCRPELRDLLMRTLEAVEDIDFPAMQAAIPWEFETYPEYLRFLQRRGLGVNFGGYIGHTALRLYVMGEDAYSRPATSDEVAAMVRVVQESIAGGALGFSSDRAGFLQGAGGRPVPSVVATASETEALLLAVPSSGAGIAHVAPGNNFRWIYDLLPRFRGTFTWSAILAFPEDNGQMVSWRDKLTYHVEHKNGADVHPQVTSRPLTFRWSLENPLTLYRYPSFGNLARSDPAGRLRALRDPAWRAGARAEMEATPHDWDSVFLEETARDDWRGRAVGSVARETGQHPLDVLVDLSLAEGLSTRVRVEAANTDPVAVGALLMGEGCVLGLSDAGAHVGQLCDAVLPLHFLSAWVRDRALFSLEAGIRKTSAELADVVGLRDRGYVRAGQWADLVVLEMERLGTGPTKRVRDLPGGGERLLADEPEGLRHVLVNGTPIRVHHERVVPDRLPGMLLGPKRY